MSATGFLVILINPLAKKIKATAHPRNTSARMNPTSRMEFLPRLNVFSNLSGTCSVVFRFWFGPLVEDSL